MVGSWLEALVRSMKGNQVKYSLALFAVSLHTGRSWWCCEINGKFHLFNIILSSIIPVMGTACFRHGSTHGSLSSTTIV